MMKTLQNVFQRGESLHKKLSGSTRLLLSLVCAMMFVLGTASAQNGTVSGTVKEDSGSPLPGASIQIKGTTKGTQTDVNGNYKLVGVPANATLVFSFVGKTNEEIAVGSKTVVNVVLADDSKGLNEVVVIGYGTQRKRDLTGSVATVTSEDFNKGPIQTPEQLVTGKIAGVQITSNGGAPGSGSQIRIRGGSSLAASNDPLIVIDGVPLATTSIDGAANPLSLVNPNDIESFTVLKDASATAIYGSRASNGVILITTKKGSLGALKVNISVMGSVASKTQTLSVLPANSFITLVNDKGTTAQKALLGSSSTDWQEAIYRTAVSTDNAISVSGGLAGMPFRASVGYTNQNGILLTSNMSRTTASFGLSPMLLDKHLKIDINVKTALIKNRFADTGTISAAALFDPTKPITGDKFGGYFEWADASGVASTTAPRNPVATLNLKEDNSSVKRTIGNVQFDYKMHFLPDLRANLNVGYDVSSSDGTVYIPTTSALLIGGQNKIYTQNKNNKVLDFYLNYVKDLGSDNRLDLMAGYSYQDFTRESSSLDKNVAGTTTREDLWYKTQNTLVSFFGRANLSLGSKYLLTATVRRDGSSRFNPDNRWGTFPSAAVAWKLSEEDFLKDKVFTNLKLRLGWGLTGQQDVLSDYPYLPRYTLGEKTASYQLGSVFYNTFRPEGYDANIKWEQTETQNAGLDFALKGTRLSGSIDAYFRKTKDLLSTIPVPAGSNLTNQILTNVGNIENKGVELALNYNLASKKDFNWDLGFNITYNENTITNLTKVTDAAFRGVLTGVIAGGVGNNIQIHSVGYSTSSYYVYKQVYDAVGKPVEGVYVDLDGDGKITENDRYRYQSPNAKVFLGFNSQMSLKKWSLAFVMRSNLGNYVYNNVNSNIGSYRNLVSNTSASLNNVVTNVLFTKFNNNQYFSDYYIENASFLRMDNATLGYNFGKVGNGNLRASINVQNVFVLTRYSGLDPEIAGGIDNNFYPRPRTFSLGLNYGF